MPAVKDILIQGGKQHKVLEMTYKKKDGSVVKRKVEPYELRGDTFWAWDTNDEHIKRFVIWRIRDVKVTKDSFDPRFDIKMSRAGGVTSKSMTSGLEITLNGLRGLLNESIDGIEESLVNLDEIHSIRRELIAQAQKLIEHEEQFIGQPLPKPTPVKSYTGQAWKVHISEDFNNGNIPAYPNGAGRGATVFLDFKKMVEYLREHGGEWHVAKLGLEKCPLSLEFGNKFMARIHRDVNSERGYMPLSEMIETETGGGIDLSKLPDDIYELPDTAGITKVGEALTKQIHGSVYRMRRIEHKRFGTVYAVWYRTYLPAYYSPKDGFIHSGGDTPLTGEVKKKTEWLVALYNKIYKDGVRPGGEHEVNEATEPLVNTKRFADDEGRIILYRGTSGKGGGFEQGDLGSGLYVTPNKGMAQAYAGMHKAGGELVFYQLNPKAKMLNSDSKAWLDIKDEFNLGVLDKVPAHKKLCDAIQKKVLGAGYDGVASWDMATGWVIMNEKVLTEIWRDRINGE